MENKNRAQTPLEDIMKKFYGLMMAGAMAGSMALMACSNDSSTTQATGGSKTASFTHDGCKRNTLNEIPEGALAKETATPMLEARLIQNGNSYQVEIPDVIESCGLESKHTTTKTERNGNTLNIEIENHMPADCGSCYYDLRVNIDKDDANALFVYINGTTYVLVKEYTTPQDDAPSDTGDTGFVADPCGNAPEQNTEPYCTVPGEKFQLSQCEVIPTNTRLYDVSEARLIEENGSYKVEMKNQTINCGYETGNATVTMTQYGDSLKATLHMNGYPTACYASCTLTLDVTPEQAAATTIYAIGNQYGSGVLKIVKEYSSAAQPVTPDTVQSVAPETSKLAATNKYGMALGECKDVDIGGLAKRNSIADMAITDSADTLNYAEELEDPTATLITEGAVTQVMIPDVMDACDVVATINVSMNKNTILIEYGEILATANCVCVKDHWFDISSLGADNLAQAHYVKFQNQTYVLTR